MPETPGAAPLLLSSRAAAKALSLCEKTLWSLRRAGKLRAVRIGPRAIRYDVADLQRFIEASKTGGPA
jgi:predicted DNA-binding transcriptional regulator AlpA